MKTYEITFITKNELEKPLVKNEIENFGGKITGESKLGQKAFVYPILKEKSGFYTTYTFEMDPEKMQELNRKLTMTEEILRHLIIFIQPSREKAEAQAKMAPAAIEVKPEVALEVAPEQEIEIAPETEIVEVEEPETKVKTEAEEKVEEPKKAVKKEKIEEAPVAEEKPKAKKMAKTKPEVEPVKEEERLEALDKKLEELLKD